jgi:hypothetical protein
MLDCYRVYSVYGKPEKTYRNGIRVVYGDRLCSGMLLVEGTEC